MKLSLLATRWRHYVIVIILPPIATALLLLNLGPAFAAKVSCIVVVDMIDVLRYVMVFVVAAGPLRTRRHGLLLRAFDCAFESKFASASSAAAATGGVVGFLPLLLQPPPLLLASERIFCFRASLWLQQHLE